MKALRQRQLAQRLGVEEAVSRDLRVAATETAAIQTEPGSRPT